MLVFINCTDKPDFMLLIIINFYLYSLVVNSLFSGRRFYLVLSKISFLKTGQDSAVGSSSVSCIYRKSPYSVSCTYKCIIVKLFILLIIIFIIIVQYEYIN